MQVASRTAVTRDTFANVIRRVQAEDEASMDVVAVAGRHIEFDLIGNGAGSPPVPGMRFQVPEIPAVNGQSVPLSNWAHGQVADRTGIPIRYYQRMQEQAPELLVSNINAWLRRAPEERLVRVMRSLDFSGGEVNVGPYTARAYLSRRYRVLSNLSLLTTAVREAEAVGAEVHTAHLDSERLYLKFVTPKLEAEVKRGDVIRAGVVVRNSEVGDGRLRVEPFFLRLVCTNGLVAATQYARTHIGNALDVGVLSEEAVEADSRAVWLQVRDWIRFAFDPKNLEEVVSRMQHTMTAEIQTNARLAVGNVIRDAGLRPTEGRELLERYLRGNDDTMWNLLNATTSLARDMPDYRRATELEGFAGKMLEQPAKRLARRLASQLTDEQLARAYGEDE